MLKVFGIEHIICLVVCVIIVILSMVLSKKYLKTDKQKTIYLKIIAGLLLVGIILNRLSIALAEGWIYLIPLSICGLTSFIFSLLVLFGKPNMRAYQCFWFMAVGGGIITLIYPDFINTASSLFEFNIITGIIHHFLCVLLALQMYMFGWFRPNLRKIYFFPMLFCVYIVVGAFEWHVLNLHVAMNFTSPLLTGTILNIWFIWVVGTAIVTCVALLYEGIIKLKNRTATPIVKNGDNKGDELPKHKSLCATGFVDNGAESDLTTKNSK